MAHLYPPAPSPPQGRKWCNWGSQGLSNAGWLFHNLLLACAKQPVHAFHNCTYQRLYEHRHCPTNESHQLPMSSLTPKVRGLHLPAHPGKMRNTPRNLNCNIIDSKIILPRMRWKTSQRMDSVETFYKVPGCQTGLGEKLLQCLHTYDMVVLLRPTSLAGFTPSLFVARLGRVDWAAAIPSLVN